jgi:hypothetical protein
LPKRGYKEGIGKLLSKEVSEAFLEDKKAKRTKHLKKQLKELEAFQKELKQPEDEKTSMYSLIATFASSRVENHRRSIYDSVPVVAQKLEANLMMSPVSFYFGESYAHPTAQTMLAGLRSKLDLRYFFGLRPGIRFTLEYRHIWNIHGEQRDSELEVVDIFAMLNATLGIVYRY